jgi:hypothetical protein
MNKAENGDIDPSHGWQIVPVDPTREMLTAGMGWSGLRGTWARMLEAAPPPPPIAPDDVERVARMIARGLGHNDDVGMGWERYIRPAQIVCRECATTPQEPS